MLSSPFSLSYHRLNILFVLRYAHFEIQCKCCGDGELAEARKRQQTYIYATSFLSFHLSPSLYIGF